jgi:hypothetical protein
MKPTKRTVRAPLPPFTGDLKETILAAVAAVGSDGKGKDGLQGYLANMARDNPKLAKRARIFAEHFARVGYGQPISSDEEGNDAQEIRGNEND